MSFVSLPFFSVCIVVFVPAPWCWFISFRVIFPPPRSVTCIRATKTSTAPFFFSNFVFLTFPSPALVSPFCPKPVTGRDTPVDACAGARHIVLHTHTTVPHFSVWLATSRRTIRGCLWFAMWSHFFRGSHGQAIGMLVFFTLTCWHNFDFSLPCLVKLLAITGDLLVNLRPSFCLSLRVPLLPPPPLIASFESGFLLSIDFYLFPSALKKSLAPP